MGSRGAAGASCKLEHMEHSNLITYGTFQSYFNGGIWNGDVLKRIPYSLQRRYIGEGGWGIPLMKKLGATVRLAR